MKQLLDQSQQHLRSLLLHEEIKNALLIAAGVASASLGLKGFLLPSDFLDGGATGVSLLLELLTKTDVSIWLILVNLPFILIGYRQISPGFALKSALAIVALAVAAHSIHFPTITSDKFLISVFGGFFLGAGIGLSIRGGAVIDGTEVLAIAVSRRSSLSVGDFISLFNVVLFSLAAFLVSLETAMYCMLTYLSASKTVDFLINGIEEYIGVTIVSDRSEEIRRVLTIELGHGVTTLLAKGGFGKTGIAPTQRDVLYCVLTRLEVTRLLFEIEKIDEGAFVVQHSVRDAHGGIVKKKPLH